MSNITVLGTGRMGSAMVARLAAAGHAVTVWNRSAAAAEDLRAHDGVQVAASAAAAVAHADLVLCTLATGEATLSVLLDPELQRALPREAIVCDMGTSGTAVAQALHELLGERFVDSPVSGSVPSVMSGQLLVMASGSPAAVAAAEPILAAFAKRVIRVGDAGAGQAMKLSVNLIVHTLNSAVAEALALAERSGIDPALAYEVYENSSIAAPYVLYKRAAFLDPQAPVAMSLALVHKDLTLIGELAAEAGLPLVVLDAVHDEVGAACADGLGAADMSQVLAHVLSRGPAAPDSGNL